MAKKSRKSRTPVPPLAPPQSPGGPHLEEIYADLFQLPNVVGCYIGRKRRGRRLTRDLSVVCCVREKVPSRKLSKGQRVPRQVKWPQLSRRTGTLLTDVRVLEESGRHTPTLLGPGDVAELSGGASSTLGAALSHPEYGKVVTTAGHAFLASPSTVVYPPGHEPVVSFENFRAGAASGNISTHLLKAVLTPDADYALLRPLDGTECRNAYQDSAAVGGAFLPRAEDTGQLPLLAMTRLGLVSTMLRGVDATIEVEGLTMRGLMLTDWVTVGGDSGCSLIDDSSRFCGLLHGFGFFEGNKYSLWTSIFWPLVAEHASLL